MQNAVTRKGEI
jgi:hypothetical protein